MRIYGIDIDHLSPFHCGYVDKIMYISIPRMSISYNIKEDIKDYGLLSQPI